MFLPMALMEPGMVVPHFNLGIIPKSSDLSLHYPVEQIGRVFDDNLRIIFHISP